MKLVRFGAAGKEKPGIIDKNGKVRDLSKIVRDIDGEALSPAGLAKIKKANIDKLPLVKGNPRLGPCVARPSNFIAIGLNYADHAAEAGMQLPKEPIIFNKALSCICGPNDNTITPKDSSKLDYEVELGIVIGKAITGPVTVTDADLADYVGAFVVANDVSARDVQLPQGQWYKGKSYRTFCPVGPYLCVPDPDEVSRWRELRLTLAVNGAPRQDSLAGDMVFGPAQTLSEFSQLEEFEVGDLLLTGTPGGVALQPPNPTVQRIVGLLPEAKKWQLFVRGQARSSAYLKPGDRVTASIRTADGTLDLGNQHNTVR
jgi:2-keto-4-pentenoate hydratase/2-oxohepta-3-ene-1,7-dioic acid hydratase in catechol pathway